MKPSRRHVLQFAGGAAVGALFTPAPWRLITDTALWSESWPGVPKPARGPIRTRFTNCSLCGAGCAMRARCVGERPVLLAGVADHPLSHGAICAFGVAAHHLPYHPARARKGSVDEARAAVSEAVARGARVAVLDLRPGRTASWTMRRAMASIPNGIYIANEKPAAVDLAQARTVVSFGAPLYEGWGTPGNVIAARPNFWLIAAEPVESRTAMMADIWVPVRPGSETAIAREVAEAIGGGTARSVEAAAIVRELQGGGPAVALDACDSEAVMELNRALGAMGKTVVARSEVPVPDGWKGDAPVMPLDSVADGAIDVLLIDEASAVEYVPWKRVSTKLAPGAVVLTFAASREGYARYARYTLGAPVFTESVEDLPPAADCCTPVFRLSAAMANAPAGMMSASEFIARITNIDAGGALRARSDAIHKAQRGSVFTYADGASRPLKDLSAGDFWKELNEGACWIGPDDARRAPVFASSRQDQPPGNVVVTERARPALVSPILSKIYQESNLRQGPRGLTLDEDTARAAGVSSGGRAVLETANGRVEMEVTIDPSAPRGVVQAASSARLADVLGGNAKVVAA